MHADSFSRVSERKMSVTWNWCFNAKIDSLVLTNQFSDVNKDWTCKNKDKNQAYNNYNWPGQGQGLDLQDKDKDLTHKDQDKDKDFTYSYLLQVVAKPTNRYQATTMNTKWKFTTLWL